MTSVSEPSAPASPGSPPPGGATSADPVAQTLALLQPWIEFVPRQQRRLGIFIFLALLAHLAIFFFIRIDTTRAELRHEPRIHVTVEDFHPTAQAGADDAFWDRLTDPRLFLLPMTSLANLSPGETALDLDEIMPGLGALQWPAVAPAAHYEVIHATAPSLEEQVAMMPPPRQPFTYDEAAPAIAAKTAWQWDEVLAGRHPADAPELPSPVSDTDLGPTELRVAVDADGSVDHVLLEESCQKPELDQQAILAARKVRFRPADQPGPAWGRLTVFWRTMPQPREEVTPTPPSQ